MRKIIAITLVCFFTLFFRMEAANSKSSCQPGCKMAVKKAALKKKAAEKKTPLKTDTSSDQNYNSLQQFEGFFFKI